MVEWSELYGLDDEDDPEDPERLTIIDDLFIRVVSDDVERQDYKSWES